MSEISQIDNQRIAKLQLAKQRFEGYDQISSSKIQRIPVILRHNAEFAKYASPKIISFGPIHHGKENLEKGENYKLLWTSMYIEEYSTQTYQFSDQVAQSLLKTIQDELGELKKLFSEDVIRTHKNEGELAWMLFVDGCSLLHFMENTVRQYQKPEALKLKLDLMMYIWRDVIMLENQVPWRLLELLSKKEGGNYLEDLMWDYVIVVGKSHRNGLEEEEPEDNQHKPPKSNHLLAYIHSFLMPDHVEDGDKSKQAPLKVTRVTTYKNIRDLKAAGVRVKAGGKFKWKISNSASFNSESLYGQLILPMLSFDSITPYFFWNMIAYEMCPDFHNKLQFCSFFLFMNSLIEDGEDVKELRLGGVIQNMVGSDKEVAKLFKDLGSGLPSDIYYGACSLNNSAGQGMRYIQIMNEVENHYTNKWKTSLAIAASKYNAYFQGPWSVIAFVAALAALALTAIQTWYAVRPNTP